MADNDGRTKRGVGPARDVACRAITGFARAYPDVHEVDVRDAGLSASDAGLARAIVRTCVVRATTLAMLSERALRRGWATLDPEVQAALMVGAAQILFFDRVPRHAAVDESVGWIRGRTPGAAKLVNAGLRELCRIAYGMGTEHDTTLGRRVVERLDEQSRRQLALGDGRALELCQEALPVDQTRRFALQTGTPLAMFNDWMREYGPARARALALHALVEPPICVNVVAEPDIAEALLTPHAMGHVRVFGGSGDELREVLARHPRVWVQDAAATIVVESLAGSAASVVVDLCAGQGTKTKHLAARFASSTVIASDPDAARAEVLGDVPRVFANVRVVEDAKVAEAVAGASAGRGADLVLLDVPCSNTGVLPRRVEAKHRPRHDQLKRLVPLQREILTRGRDLAAQGGLVVYSTCSIDRAENQEQAAWASQHLGLVLERESLTLPGGLPGEAAGVYHDGAYHVLLRRA